MRPLVGLLDEEIYELKRKNKYLLEALEELARLEFDNFEQHITAIDKAKAAIAKAKA